MLRNGSEELTAAVESGGLAVSAASVLAGLPWAEQAAVVASGVVAAARKARELRNGGEELEPARPSPGRFQVLAADAGGALESRGADAVLLLWLAAGGLAEAIGALRDRGFYYVTSPTAP